MLDGYLKETAELIVKLQFSTVGPRFDAACDLLTAALRKDRPVLVAGNGGSAADAMHLAGELAGRFGVERRALNVRALCDPASLTAIGNDYGFEEVFSRQVDAYGAKGGVLVAISTSGNSLNIVQAAKRARIRAMSVIALTGAGGGALAPHSDVLLDVPSKQTAHVQEMHLCIYHAMCRAIDRQFA